MRLVLQRVSSAAVRVDGETIGAIGPGLLVLVGVREGADEGTARRLAAKTAALRVFPDDEGRFNRSLLETHGEALVVSQFTLYADVRRGRRPSFTDAARPEVAEPLVEAYAAALEALGVRVARGRFGAKMEVELVNDGPVTLVIDSSDLERPPRAQ
ncbi:MAG TPA: D-aminoacyl-tRNA deacylase [Dehalococcoidia bacterium]|nr:D-aminoacyl-tRNA deacylase [Dehalococcoidia bacterium]